MPDDIVDQIYKYIELFDDEEFLEVMSKSSNMEKFEDQLNNRFDSIINAMRDELAFEKLNVDLKKRIGGRLRGVRHLTLSAQD